MRLNAEKERICHYRDIARKSAIMYYKILKEIMKYNLIHVIASKNSPEKSGNQVKIVKKSNQPNFYQQKETKINCIYYITDYIKLVIENGQKFTQENMYCILDTMIVEELSDEVINTFKIIIKELKSSGEEFDEDLLKSYANDKANDERKKKKILKMLEELPEPLE